MKTNGKTSANTTRAYDPGTIRDFREVSDGVFYVRSFKEDRWYRVDLNAGTCGCEAHARKPTIACKHMVAMAVVQKASRKPLPYLDGRIAEFTAAGATDKRALAQAARRLAQERVQRQVADLMTLIHGLSSPRV